MFGSTETFKSKNILGPHRFWVLIIWVQTDLLKKMLGQKVISGPKNVGFKKFWMQKFISPKNYKSKKIFGQKKSGQKKVLAKKIFGSNFF